MQELEPGSIQRLHRSFLRGREQPQRLRGSAGQVLADGGFQRAVGPTSRLGRECRRSLEEGCRGREPTSRASTRGRLLELDGNVLITPGNGVRAMPGPAV